MGKGHRRFLFMVETSISFVVLMLLVPAPALTGTYYISPNGDDKAGSGTQSSPWKTLSYACDRVPADQGHTIHLSSGVFLETSQSIVPTGVNIEGEGPNNTIIKSSYDGWLILLQSNPIRDGNQTLRGFKIDGQNRRLDQGIVIKGRHNVKVHDIYFEEIDNVGLEIIADYGPDENKPPSEYLSGIEVYNCSFKNCAKDFSGWSGGCLQIGHLIGALIHDITIDESIGYGIKYWQGGWFKGIKIYDCNITVPGYDPFWSSDIAIELWNIYDGCEVYDNNVDGWLSFVYGNKGKGRNSVKVYGNRVVFHDRPQNSTGIEVSGGLSDVEIYDNYIERANFGVAVWGEKNISNILVHHNVFFDISHPRNWNSGVEIHVNSGLSFSDIRVYNNVFHNIQTSNWGVIGVKKVEPGTLQNLEVKNNIFMNSEGNVGEYVLSVDGRVENSIITYNCFYNVTKGRGGSFHNNIYVKPQLIAAGNRPDPYYRPASESSSLVDAGADVGLPFAGSAPDIGAFEFRNGDR